MCTHIIDRWGHTRENWWLWHTFYVSLWNVWAHIPGILWLCALMLITPLGITYIEIHVTWRWHSLDSTNLGNCCLFAKVTRCPSPCVAPAINICKHVNACKKNMYGLWVYRDTGLKVKQYRYLKQTMYLCKHSDCMGFSRCLIHCHMKTTLWWYTHSSAMVGDASQCMHKKHCAIVSTPSFPCSTQEKIAIVSHSGIQLKT